jgi:hypothetical protein
MNAYTFFLLSLTLSLFLTSVSDNSIVYALRGKTGGGGGSKAGQV